MENEEGEEEETGPSWGKHQLFGPVLENIKVLSQHCCDDVSEGSPHIRCVPQIWDQN